MENENRLDQLLRWSLIENAFAQGQGGALFNGIAVIGIALLHKSMTGDWLAPAWLMAMFVVIAVRLATLRWGERTFAEHSLPFMERLFWIPLAAVSLSWALLPFQLRPDIGTEELLVLALIHFGLAGRAASVLAPVQWSARFYIACLLLPGAILFFVLPSPNSAILGGLTVSYLLTMLSAHHWARRTLLTARRSLIENQGLLGEARRQQEIVEALNRDLVAARDALTTQNAGLERIVAERTAKVRLASAAIENIAAGVIVTDAEGLIVDANPAFCAMTGMSPASIVGQPIGTLNPADHDPFAVEAMWGELRRLGHWSGEVWSRKADGGLFLERRSIDAVRDADGAVTHYVFAVTDITESQEKDERIRFLAFHDALTGLPNRFLLEDRLRHGIEMARRDREQLGLMFLDLDQFKSVNDSLGHQVGDMLLMEVSQRVKSLVRQSDTVARLGGDEFVVLVRGLQNGRVCAMLARKIIEAISEPIQVLSHRINIGTSIGVAVFPDDGTDGTTLMKNADVAMYAAKAAGRGVYRFFEPAMSEAAQLRLELETALRHALAHGELSLHYQPKVVAGSGEIVGYEALLRWHNVERGAIQPSQFIPVAEDCGLIGELGRWTLREACRQIAAWHRAGYGWQRVAVNISARQFVEGDLVGEILCQAEAAEIPPTLLEIELTESMVMNRPDDAAQTLQALKELGVTVAIDDFGTGYSSLAYLRRLPIDVLKIDRSFVGEADLDEHGVAIIHTILALARTLGLAVVAEGVETESQADLLRRGGCDFLQGYLFSRPVPAEVIEERWRSAAATVPAPAG